LAQNYLASATNEARFRPVNMLQLTLRLTVALGKKIENVVPLVMGPTRLRTRILPP